MAVRPDIEQIEASQAVVQAQARVTAICQGCPGHHARKRGDPDQIPLVVASSATGWKWRGCRKAKKNA